MAEPGSEPVYWKFTGFHYQHAHAAPGALARSVGASRRKPSFEVTLNAHSIFILQDSVSSALGAFLVVSEADRNQLRMSIGRERQIVECRATSSAEARAAGG